MVGARFGIHLHFHSYQSGLFVPILPAVLLHPILFDTFMVCWFLLSQCAYNAVLDVLFCIYGKCIIWR